MNQLRNKKFQQKSLSFLIIFYAIRLSTSLDTKVQKWRCQNWLESNGIGFHAPSHYTELKPNIHEKCYRYYNEISNGKKY